MTSATTASHVPTLETSVARNRLRKSGSRTSSPSRSRAPQAPRPTRGTVARCLANGCGECSPERLGAEQVLVLRADGDPDRVLGSELVQRTDDHALAEQRGEELAAVSRGL